MLICTREQFARLPITSSVEPSLTIQPSRHIGRIHRGDAAEEEKDLGVQNHDGKGQGRQLLLFLMVVVVVTLQSERIMCTSTAALR